MLLALTLSMLTFQFQLSVLISIATFFTASTKAISIIYWSASTWTITPIYIRYKTDTDWNVSTVIFPCKCSSENVSFNSVCFWGPEMFCISLFFQPCGWTQSSPMPDLVGLVSRLQPWLRWPRGRFLSVRLLEVLLAEVAAVPIVGLGILP